MRFPRSGGGGFLIAGAPAPADLLTPEDLDEDHRAIGRTVDEFWARDVAPALPALYRREPGAARALLRKAAALGLTAIQLPERFGGLDLDLSAVMVASEHLAEDPSYAGWHQGQIGIGTLPLLYFGTEDQQRRYLPRLASAELVAAYALTEPHAGSDARAIRTRADLAPDGRHYLLNGQKTWITNGGEADLFTVFAKVGGEHFTAFLVERAFGVRSGPDEHKMGLDGTSTTALYFDNVPVPVENVLGEIGGGHRVAFNVLNAGRLKIGANALRAARKILAVSTEYARTREAFGGPIARFGAIREKLAGMAVRLFAAEAAVWRTVGLVQALTREREGAVGRSAAELAAFEEFAVECSIVKVHSSEMLDWVADEGVQIHGGYGFHRDYFVERAYRDARINRIFEGTSEINRLLIPQLLLKRASVGRLPLLEHADRVRASPPGERGGDALSGASRAKTVALVAVSVVHEAYGDVARAPQEVLLRVADLVIESFVLEAAAVRAAKIAEAGGGPAATDLARVYGRESLARVIAPAAAELCAAAAPEDGALAARVSQITSVPPEDTIALRARIASRLVDEGRHIPS